MGRLFWKLFVSFWLAMMSSFIAGVAFLRFFGHGSPPEGSAFVLVPIATGAAVSFLFSYALAWYLSHPLRHLQWALHSVSQGDFSTRVRPLMGTRRDEIVDLGEDFDAMADRLQQLVEARQRLLHDISHELRSPLTRIQVAIGLLRQDPAKVHAMIERIEAEAHRLDIMVGEILTLARLEGGHPVVAREKVDLIELLGEIAEDAAFEASASGLVLDCRMQGTFVVTVAADLLCRAFDNIVRNAVKYAPKGTVVDVRAVVTDKGTLRVSVEDEGPGVPEVMLERIFEPFMRLADIHGQHGHGLGLAIARRAVEANGGRVWAERRSEEGGLRIVLEIAKTE